MTHLLSLRNLSPYESLRIDPFEERRERERERKWSHRRVRRTFIGDFVETKQHKKGFSKRIFKKNHNFTGFERKPLK